MQLHKGIASLSLLSLSTLFGEGRFDLDDSFSFAADYLFMKRSLTNNHALVVDSSTGFSNVCGGCDYDVLCSTKKLVHGMDFSSGIKVETSYATRGSIWQLFYLWISPWESHCQAAVPDSLIFSQDCPNFSTDFSYADSATTKAKTSFENGEWNYLKYLIHRKSNFFGAYFLGGMRYINLPDHLTISFTNDGETSSYTIKTKNRLAGLQVGLGIEWNPTSKISWDLLGKGAAFYDWAASSSFVGDLGNSITLASSQANKAAYPLGIDVACKFTYIPASMIYLTLGYEFIYLNGVALTENQIHREVSSIRGISSGGVVMIQGFFGGVQLNF